MNTARQIINEIIQEGAEFTLNGGEVGLTKMVSDDLLARARKHKVEIKKIILAVKCEQTKTSRLSKHTKVTTRIKELKSRAQKRADITADKVLAEYEKIAFGSIYDLYDRHGKLKPIDKLDDETKAKIKSVKIKYKAEVKKVIETAKREQTKTSKVWNLVIRSCDGKSISRITMIDPSRLNDLECKEHLIKQFGKNRIIEFKEHILSKSI